MKTRKQTKLCLAGLIDVLAAADSDGNDFHKICTM